MWIVRFSSCKAWTVSCVFPVDSSLIEITRRLNCGVSFKTNILAQPNVLGSNK